MYDALYARSEDWLKYAIQINLLHAKKDDIIALRESALSDAKIQHALNNVAHYHNVLITNHKNPTLPIQQLLFLLDLGFDTDIPQIKSAIDEILAHKDGNGVYQSITNIPAHFGGSGKDTFGWCLCDAPLLLLALLKAGVPYEPLIKPGVDYLITLITSNGFPCAVSPEHGSFRGPGKKSDCCPYATLIMTDLLSYLPEYQKSPVLKTSAESLLALWETSLSKHPYMFYMGTDFRKLKAPSSWYDIISVAGVLSKLDFIQTNPRFIEMINLIKSKQDHEGFFTPESVYSKCSEWDFGQKKSVSPYVTYLCMQIFQRLK